MKTREEQLESCKVCMKRKFLMNKGLVCSLTNMHAEFENDCSDFEVDIVAFEKEEIQKKDRKDESLSMATGGLDRVGIKNGGVAGFIIISLGCIWLFGGIIFMNLIFYYSFVIILIGLTLIINYFIALNRKRKKESFLLKNDEVLDLD